MNSRRQGKAPGRRGVGASCFVTKTLPGNMPGIIAIHQIYYLRQGTLAEIFFDGMSQAAGRPGERDRPSRFGAIRCPCSVKQTLLQMHRLCFLRLRDRPSPRSSGVGNRMT